MRTLIACLAAMCGIVLFVAPAGAQSSSTIDGWGISFGDTPVPLAGASGPSGVMQMVTTNSDTYVLDDQGTVWAAGKNDAGELGNGKANDVVATTFHKVKNLPAIQSLALVGPQGTMMALASDGDVYGWGDNQYDQLCIPGEAIPANPSTANEVLTPIDLSQELGFPSGVTMMAGAGDHATYYVASTDTLYSCGQNRDGDLGDDVTNSMGPVPSPTPVVVQGITDSSMPDDSPVVLMTASWSDEGVLLQDGTYWTWGDNYWGQLGYTPPVTYDAQGDSYIAYQVPLPGQVAIDQPQGALFPNQTVTQGGGSNKDGQAMAILADGSYFGWGDDTDAQLCNGSAITTTSDNGGIPLTDFTGGVPPLAEVASGGTTGYLLDTSGNVYSCGANNYGQLGNGKMDNDIHPAQHHIIPAGNGTEATEVSSTQYNAAAVVTTAG